MRKQMMLLSLLALILCTAPHLVAGTIEVEVGDAGQTVSSAQVLPGGTTVVTGEITDRDADLFRFSWGGGEFSADTFGSGFDTVLYLFDGNGVGIRNNDDIKDSGHLQSKLLPFDLAAGEYIIGVAAAGYNAWSSEGQIFPTGNNTWFKQNIPYNYSSLTYWQYSGIPDPLQKGDYTITIASVPEPSLLTLLGIGIGMVGGVAGWKNRKKQIFR